MPPESIPTTGTFDGLIVFAASLLVGGVAIHVAARYVAHRDGPGGRSFAHAVVTALLGALAWAVLSWVPLIGALLGLVGWIAVIRLRYPVGWIRAIAVGVAAWAAAVVALAALDLVGVGSVSALGVPGT